MRNIPPAVALLIGANAATQFAIQAWMAYGFAEKVWRLRQPLPWFAPVALDVFAVTMMALTYHLRNAHWRTRAYAWFWLAVAIAAQIGASEGFADHENWSVWGRAASVLPAVFLAASLHAFIIMVRRREHDLAPLAEVTEQAGPSRWTRWRAGRTAAARIRRERRAAAKVRRPVFVKPRTETVVKPAPVPAETTAVSWSFTAPAPVVTPMETPAVPVAAPVETPVPPTPPAAAPRPAAIRPPAPTRTRAERSQLELLFKRCLDADPAESVRAVALDLGLPVRSAGNWVNAEKARREGESRG